MLKQQIADLPEKSPLTNLILLASIQKLSQKTSKKWLQTKTKKKRTLRVVQLFKQSSTL
jgi:hypothetical protein